MSTKFIKSHSQKRKPGYRTADFIRGKTFGPKKGPVQAGFNPASFKVQHKG
jgi:hypothetical protein